MSVTTKTGDRGETSLYTGERVPKDSQRVITYGTIDEIGSALALARATAQNEFVRDEIYTLQKQLASLMADFASLDKQPLITPEFVTDIEQKIAAAEAKLPLLREFLIPGDSLAGAALDMARTTARRAERECCSLCREEPIADSDRIFLNRLSDYCFLLMRLEEHR